MADPVKRSPRDQAWAEFYQRVAIEREAYTVALRPALAEADRLLHAHLVAALPSSTQADVEAARAVARIYFRPIEGELRDTMLYRINRAADELERVTGETIDPVFRQP
jgi:hypothetical protein